MRQNDVTKLVFCAFFAALTCVLAPISIPIGQVPISLATLAVMLSAALLGPRLGMLSQCVYLLLGAVGLPVFAGFSAGAGVLFGPTGGYLFGYLLLALVEGAFYRKAWSNWQGKWKKSGVLLLAMVIGTAALYTVGTVWFTIVTHTPIAAALMTCVVPFLPGDVAKMAVTAVLVPQLERMSKYLQRSAHAV